MHTILTLFKKEFRSFFTSATGYIVLALFLLGTGLFLWVLPGGFNVLDGGYAQLDGLFTLAPWLYLFLCPAVTMRLFAEERSQGTLEVLFTRPASKWSLVIGKALSGWALVVMALLPTIVWYITLNFMAEPFGNVDHGAFWGSFIGLILLAGIYCAVGTFASSVSSNQIVAFILAATLCFVLFYGFALVGSLVHSGDLSRIIKSFGIDDHYKSMSRGVIYSLDLLYFFLLSTLFVWLTKLQISKKI